MLLVFARYEVASVVCELREEGSAASEECAREMDEAGGCETASRVALFRVDELAGAAPAPIDRGIARGCRRSAEPRTGLRDLDLDGRPELLVDLSSVDGTTELMEYGGWERTIAVFDHHLRPQLPPARSSSIGNPVDVPEPAEHRGTRLRFRDVDGDGHPDAVLEEVTYRNGEDEICRTDAEGMLAATQPEVGEGSCVGEVRERVLRWDASSDRWSE